MFGLQNLEFAIYSNHHRMLGAVFFGLLHDVLLDFKYLIPDRFQGRFVGNNRDGFDLISVVERTSNFLVKGCEFLLPGLRPGQFDAEFGQFLRNDGYPVFNGRNIFGLHVFIECFFRFIKFFSFLFGLYSHPSQIIIGCLHLHFQELVHVRTYRGIGNHSGQFRVCRNKTYFYYFSFRHRFHYNIGTDHSGDGIGPGDLAFLYLLNRFHGLC